VHGGAGWVCGGTDRVPDGTASRAEHATTGLTRG